jgi:hypothetical protein
VYSIQPCTPPEDYRDGTQRHPFLRMGREAVGRIEQGSRAKQALYSLIHVFSRRYTISRPLQQPFLWTLRHQRDGTTVDLALRLVQIDSTQARDGRAGDTGCSPMGVNGGGSGITA